MNHAARYDGPGIKNLLFCGLLSNYQAKANPANPFVQHMRSFLSRSIRGGLVASGAGFGLLLAVGATPSQAFPITPGIDNLSGGTNFANGSWTLGYEFSLSQTSTINALGSYDQNGDGLGGTYAVGLWQTDGTLIASSTVSSSDPFASGFRWADILDVTLAPGNYIVASAGDWLANGDNYFFSGSFTTAPQLTYIIDRYNPGGSLTFPTISGGGVAPGWLGGNVSFSDGTPVPGPLPLLGAGAAFGWSRRLRKRVRSNATVRLSHGNLG